LEWIKHNFDIEEALRVYILEIEERQTLKNNFTFGKYETHLMTKLENSNVLPEKSIIDLKKRNKSNVSNFKEYLYKTKIYKDYVVEAHKFTDEMKQSYDTALIEYINKCYKNDKDKHFADYILSPFKYNERILKEFQESKDYIDANLIVKYDTKTNSIRFLKQRIFQHTQIERDYQDFRYTEDEVLAIVFKHNPFRFDKAQSLFFNKQGLTINTLPHMEKGKQKKGDYQEQQHDPIYKNSGFCYTYNNSTNEVKKQLIKEHKLSIDNLRHFIIKYKNRDFLLYKEFDDKQIKIFQDYKHSKEVVVEEEEVKKKTTHHYGNLVRDNIASKYMLHLYYEKLTEDERKKYNFTERGWSIEVIKKLIDSFDGDDFTDSIKTQVQTYTTPVDISCIKKYLIDKHIEEHYPKTKKELRRIVENHLKKLHIQKQQQRQTARRRQGQTETQEEDVGRIVMPKASFINMEYEKLNLEFGKNEASASAVIGLEKQMKTKLTIDDKEASSTASASAQAPKKVKRFLITQKMKEQHLENERQLKEITAYNLQKEEELAQAYNKIEELEEKLSHYKDIAIYIPKLPNEKLGIFLGTKLSNLTCIGRKTDTKLTALRNPFRILITGKQPQNAIQLLEKNEKIVNDFHNGKFSYYICVNMLHN